MHSFCHPRGCSQPPDSGELEFSVPDAAAQLGGPLPWPVPMTWEVGIARLGTSTSAQAGVQEAQSPCFTGIKEDMSQVCFLSRVLSAGALQRAAVVPSILRQ